MFVCIEGLGWSFLNTCVLLERWGDEWCSCEESASMEGHILSHNQYDVIITSSVMLSLVVLACRGGGGGGSMIMIHVTLPHIHKQVSPKVPAQEPRLH